jgi:nicotinate-nucleotide adenylyltransferase
MRLGVLGGTFDPVHNAHLLLAETAREDLDLDRVLFVPAGQPWRKQRSDIAAASDRIAMLRLATAGNAAFDVSSLEVEREGPTYTEITLEALLKQYGKETELFFMLGRDALRDFPNWHNPRRIVELATLVVAERGGAGPALETEPALPGIVARLCLLRMPRLDITSTDIRLRVREGRSIRYLVPDGVAAYIEERSLYRSK